MVAVRGAQRARRQSPRPSGCRHASSRRPYRQGRREPAVSSTAPLVPPPSGHGPRRPGARQPAGDQFIAGRSIRIFRSEKIKTTAVALIDPGTYRIEQLPGPPQVTRIREAVEPPNARVTARVRGRGARRVLSYNIRRRPGQRVIFTELTATGTGRQIGTVSGGGKGRLRFTRARPRPPPHPGAVRAGRPAGREAHRRQLQAALHPAGPGAAAEGPAARHQAARQLAEGRRRDPLRGRREHIRREAAADPHPQAADRDPPHCEVEPRNLVGPRGRDATHGPSRHPPLPCDGEAKDALPEAAEGAAD